MAQLDDIQLLFLPVYHHIGVRRPDVVCIRRMDLDACHHGVITLRCVYDLFDGMLEVFLDHLSRDLRQFKQAWNIPIGDLLDQPSLQKALLDILFVDLDVEFARVQFVKEQTEGPAGAGFFLDPSAFAEAGLAVFVDRRMRDDIVDVALFAARPGAWCMAAFSPVLPAVNIPARLEKLNASPQMCLMMLRTVWDISSLQTQTEAMELSSLKPNSFRALNVFLTYSTSLKTLSKFSFITSSNFIEPPHKFFLRLMVLWFNGPLAPASPSEILRIAQNDIIPMCIFQ